MIEERKDGIKDGATVEALRWAMQTFSGWTPFLIISNLIGALNTLRDRIEKDQTGELRRRPFLQLDYDFPKLSPEEKKKIDAEGDVAKGINALLEKDFPDILAWFQLTQGVSLQVGPPKEDGSAPSITVRVPAEAKALNEKLDAMTEDQRKAEMARLSRGWTIKEWGIKPPIFSRVTTEGEVEFEAAVAFRVLPLTVLYDGSRSFFPVLVGLEISKGELPAPSSLAWMEFWGQLIDFFTPLLRDLHKQLQDKTAAKLTVPSPRPPSRSLPISRDQYTKAPARLFDTPRAIEAKNKQSLLPIINEWYLVNTSLNRRVMIAAAKLTNKKDRETINGLQEVTLKELEELVYTGAPAHGQHLHDLLERFAWLSIVPVLLERVEFIPVSGGKNKRYVPKRIFLKSTIIQSYGPIIINRETGKRIQVDDPSYSKDREKKESVKQPRYSLPTSLSTLPVGVNLKNIWSDIFRAYPKDKYHYAGIAFRWNTDVAEDFIFPQYALDEKGNVRLDIYYKPLRTGKRFIMVYDKYFEVAKRLAEKKMEYAQRLFDYLISEKTNIKLKGNKIAVEINAQSIMTILGLWDQYDSGEGRKKRVLETIRDAVIALKVEGVLLEGSDPLPIQYPEGDKRQGRRINKFYRWYMAREWSTLALVKDEQAKEGTDGESAAGAEGKEEIEIPANKIKPDQDEDIQPKERFLPGIILPAVPTGEDVKVARAAAGLSLREWQRRVNAGLPKGMKGPSIFFWASLEKGKIGEKSIRKLSPAVLEKVKALVAEFKPKSPAVSESVT